MANKQDQDNQEDYAKCSQNADGKHTPEPASVHDQDMPEGYFTISCSGCLQTTGYPMPDAQDIDWG